MFWGIALSMRSILTTEEENEPLLSNNLCIYIGSVLDGYMQIQKRPSEFCIISTSINGAKIITEELC